MKIRKQMILLIMILTSSLTVIPVNGYDFGEVYVEVKGVSTGLAFNQYILHDSILYFSQYERTSNIVDDVYIGKYINENDSHIKIFNAKDYLEMGTQIFRFFDFHPNGSILYIIVEDIADDIWETNPVSMMSINIETKNVTMELELPDSLANEDIRGFQVDEKRIAFTMHDPNTILVFNHKLEDKLIIDHSDYNYLNSHGKPQGSTFCMDAMGYWMYTYVVNSPRTNNEAVFYHLNSTGGPDKILRYNPANPEAMEIYDGSLYYFADGTDVIYRAPLFEAEKTDPNSELASFSLVTFTISTSIIYIFKRKRNYQ